ncbi:MAG: hypothetical protein U0166_08780 [Acidobacteriota bacterium]
MTAILAILLRGTLRTFFGARDIVLLAMRRASRRRGPVWGRIAYSIALFGVILATASRGMQNADQLPHAGRNLFIAQTLIQGFVAFIFPPMLMAQAVADERRRGTILLLLLTHKNPAHVVRGLLTSRLLLMFAIFMGGAPVAAIAAQLGGVSWQDILYLTAGSLALATLGASVGAYFGADLPPKLAPFFACVVNLGLLWFFYYPVLILVALGFGLSAIHVPAVAVAAIIIASVGVMLAIVHRFLTREAGKALIRRTGDAHVVPLPPPRKPSHTRAARKLKRLEAMRALEPDAGIFITPRIATFAALASLAVALLVIAIPHRPAAFEILGGVLSGGLAFGGATIVLVVLAGAAFYPAIRLSSFRGDPTTVILALTPFDGSLLLPGLERRLLVLFGVPFTVAALWILPACINGAVPLSLYAQSVLATACLVLACLALSELVGIGERRPIRAIGAMVIVAATALATLLFLPEKLQILHPLAVPVTLLAGAITTPMQAATCYALLPVALAVRFIAHRRLSKMWREPFESMGEAQYSLGL